MKDGTKLGKIPSKYIDDRKVVGFGGWPTHVSTAKDIALWQREPDYGACINTRLYRAIDVDIASIDKAAEVRDMIVSTAGRMHLRSRPDSGKCLLVFKLEGELPKRVIRTRDGIIELLGTGQQFIACGTHIKGERYVWPDGMPGENFPVAELTLAELNELWDGLMLVFGLEQSEQRAGARPTVPRSAEQRHGDPLVAFLQEHGWVQDGGYAPDGRVDVRCPWSSAHTVDSGITSSSYFPKNVGGFSSGAYRCLHGHCSDKNLSAFEAAVGYVLEDFEELPSGGSNEPALLPALERNPKGKILATRNNLFTILQGPGEWAGARLGYDSFRGQLMLAPAGSVMWRSMADEDYTALSKRLESGSNGFVHISADLMREMVRYVAHQHSFDSARQWLEGLKWDGVPRVDAFLSNHFGVAATPYTRAVARYLWSALAGRCLQPGIKADMVLVLAGPQGAGKSSIVKALAPTPEAFLELALDQSEDDQMRQMCGKLVIEFGELRGLRAREQDALKAFMVRQTDAWIPKYQEFERQYPRRSVFIGTTNSTDFLVDPTGHRRWLPVEVPSRSQEEVNAAVAAVERDRDQLWAEGRMLFAEGGIQWAEAEDLARDEVGKFEAIDAWTDAVHAWLQEEDFPAGDEAPGRRGDRPFTSGDVLAGAIRLPLEKVTDSHRKRVTSVLRGLGYTAQRQRVGGARSIYFSRTGGAL